jgi:transcriptional regulator with XRE-family HTH domain
MAARKPRPPSNRAVTGIDKLIGNRLRARRLEMHISQSELADKLGVSFQQVQKYEKGVNRVGAGRLQQIAGVLQTDIPYFMGDVGNGKSPTLSKVSTFMATKDGLDIVEAMIKLESPLLRKSVIQLARTLGNVYGDTA